MPVGSPPYYDNVVDLQKGIDDYFAKTPENRITVTGLALHLGFTTRQGLLNYEEKPEFVDSIKRAKLKVEQAYENRLIDRGNGGDIFALKNFDWKDKTEVDQSITDKTILAQLKELKTNE